MPRRATLGVRRSRATTLLNTTTMQNVEWPIMIVHTPNGCSNVLMPERSAMPVMMPGKAIGRTRRNDTA